MYILYLYKEIALNKNDYAKLNQFTLIDFLVGTMLSCHLSWSQTPSTHPMMMNWNWPLRSATQDMIRGNLCSTFCHHVLHAIYWRDVHYCNEIIYSNIEYSLIYYIVWNWCWHRYFSYCIWCLLYFMLYHGLV